MADTAESDARRQRAMSEQLYDIAGRIDAHIAISPNELRTIAVRLERIARRVLPPAETVLDPPIPPWCVEHQAYNCPHSRGERPCVIPPGS